MKTRIMVDSTADLMPEHKDRVHSVPLTLNFGQEEYFSKPVLLGYSGLSDALLRKYIEDSCHIWENHLDAPRYTSIGSVIGTHAGPGAVVVAFFRN